MRLRDVMNLCLDKIESTPSTVGKKTSPLELKKRVNFKLRSTPSTEEELIQDMKDYLEYTPNTRTPHFQNQLFSGLQSFALAGDWLSSVTNSTMATYEVSPFATLAERELVEHFTKKIGWSSGEGIMVTGGSNANFYGLLVARNTLYPATKINGHLGMRLVAFVSEEAHYSFDKAVNMMGLGLNALKKVPSDHEGKMIPSELRQMIIESFKAGEIPFFIGATAGTTVLGAYDPIDEISKIAQEFKLWLHVDGAWGGSVIFSERHRNLMKGVEKADSLALDTHKMLGTGLMSSFFLTKHSEVLRKSNNSGGDDYIFHESEGSSYDTGPSSLQCGRRVDALKVWLAWRSLGDIGVEKMIDQFFYHAQWAKDFVQTKKELILLHEPQMLNVCFMFKNESQQVKIIRERLLNEGSFYVNISTRRGKTFFRMILVNPELTPDVIERTIHSIIKLGEL